MRNLLGELGLLSVYEAENGEQALATLEENVKLDIPIDLMLLDWNMPVMSGIELLKCVRQIDRFRLLPIIMITSEDGFKELKMAVDLGVDNYVTKPFTRKTLHEKLNKVWAKYAPVTPSAK